MPNLSGPTLVVILFIVLLLFGAPKLPALAKSLGQSMKILKKEVGSDDEASAKVAADGATTREPELDEAARARAELAQARAEAEAARAEAEALRRQAERASSRTAPDGATSAGSTPTADPAPGGSSDREQSASS